MLPELGTVKRSEPLNMSTLAPLSDTIFPGFIVSTVDPHQHQKRLHRIRSIKQGLTSFFCGYQVLVHI